MLDTSDMDRDEAELLEEVYNELSKRFRTSIENDFDLPFENFQLSKVYSNFAFTQAIQIHENFGKGYILPIQIQTKYSSSSVSTEHQLWGVVRLSKSFGHIFIKRENLRDRFLELFQPLEMNFAEDKEFCNKFYVLVKDVNKGSSIFNSQFRQALMKLSSSNIQLEILDQDLIIGNSKSLGNEGYIEIADFVMEVCNINF